MKKIVYTTMVALLLVACSKESDDTGSGTGGGGESGGVTEVTPVTSDLTVNLTTDKACYRPGESVSFTADALPAGAKIRYRTMDKQGVGVCEGIAKAVKVLCDALGLWCMIAICGNNPEKGIKYRHTWNIVRIGGQYYHLDATFDNSLTRGAREDAEYRYDYFNLDDKAMFRDHEPLIAPAPACTDNGHFYYKEKKLSFTKMEEVKKRAQQAVKKGKVLTFHWRGSYLTRDVLREILNVLEDAGKEKSKLPHIYANAAQAVFRVCYSDIDTLTPEVVLEDANEGEKTEKGLKNPE